MSPTATAIVGTSILFIFLTVLVFYVLLVIAGWKIFEKAGEKGWKVLIPIYNLYIMFKIVGMSTWFWICLVVYIIASVVTVVTAPEATASSDVTEPTMSPLAALTTFVEMTLFIIVNVIYAIRTSRAFGKGGGFAVGLFFLPNIFWLILGFGKAKYHKKVALAK